MKNNILNQDEESKDNKIWKNAWTKQYRIKS